MSFTTHSYGDIRVLELNGRFDAHIAPEVKQWQNSAIATSKVVVNLSGVNFIDSTALATLVSNMKRCRQNGGDLHLCGLQQPVRIIFELTKLDRAFSLYTSEQEAIGAF